MKKIYIAAICATSIFLISFGSDNYFNVDYRSTDNPSAGRFDISFTNTTKRNICFGATSWPLQGELYPAPGEVWIQVDSVKYVAKPAGEACVSCKAKIRPGETISGSLSYRMFQLPQKYYGKAKILHFDVTGYKCSYLGG